MKKQADCNFRVPDRIFTETILKQELPDLLEALCRIPAPSGQEDGRIAFIGDRLQEYSIPFFVDTAKNLLIFFGPQDTAARKRILLSAHTDTVFPDTKPMPLTRDEERICCPGAGDNTACAAILLLYLKYARQALEQSPKPLLFAFNSCEEGLGNLKGIRRIMETYGDRIQEATAFDGGVSGVCREAVGSLRYQVTIRTRGGHSFNDFGNRQRCGGHDGSDPAPLPHASSGSGKKHLQCGHHPGRHLRELHSPVLHLSAGIPV